jgi:hypothetical protein
MTPVEIAVLVSHRAQQAMNGKSITYRRGSDAADGLVAVPGKVRNSDFSLDPNVSITGREQDWIVATIDLAISGQLTLPKQKDEIDWTDANGNVHTYRVMRRIGDRCYRHDGSHQLLRIFTVEQSPSGE